MNDLCYLAQRAASLRNLSLRQTIFNLRAEISALIAHRLVRPSVSLKVQTRRSDLIVPGCYLRCSRQAVQSGVRTAGPSIASPTCHLDQKAATLRQRDLSDDDDLAQEVVALLNLKTRLSRELQKRTSRIISFFSVFFAKLTGLNLISSTQNTTHERKRVEYDRECVGRLLGIATQKQENPVTNFLFFFFIFFGFFFGVDVTAAGFTSGYLEFHSTFCLSLRLRKPELTRTDTQGLTLWKSHWKVRKLVTEMARMSWLNGSMATRVRCGCGGEGRRGDKKEKNIKCESRSPRNGCDRNFHHCQI